MVWFWKKKSIQKNIEIGFEFNKNGDASPPKSSCPAKVSIIKYQPINFTWEVTTDNGLWAKRNVEKGAVPHNKRTSEATALEEAAKLSISVIKTKPIKIEPIKFTKKIKKEAMIFAHRYHNLCQFFWEKAEDTCKANIYQIISALKGDLRNHIANMQKVYDVRIAFKKITSDIEKISAEIATVKNERAEKRLQGKSYANENNKLGKLNDESRKLQEEQDKLYPDYRTVTEAIGKKIGKEIVSNMVARVHISSEEIEKVKSFYKRLWKTMHPDAQLPQWANFERADDEANLIESVFEEQIIMAMCQYGITLMNNGTFKEIVDDLRGET